MEELRTAFVNYATLTATLPFADDEFHTLGMFDVDVLSSNFQFKDIRFLRIELMKMKRHYNSVIAKYTWQIAKVDKNSGLIIAFKNGVPVSDKNLKVEYLPLESDRPIQCVHYTLPNEKYAIWATLDTMPKDWYPLPRQYVTLGGKNGYL